MEEKEGTSRRGKSLVSLGFPRSCMMMCLGRTLKGGLASPVGVAGRHSWPEKNSRGTPAFPQTDKWERWRLFPFECQWGNALCHF